LRAYKEILEGLNEKKITHIIKEGSSPIVPPNNDNSTPDGMKKGDTVRVEKTYYDKMGVGTIWRCVNVAGEDYEDKSGKWTMYLFVKINVKTGKNTVSNVSKINMSGSIFLDKKDISLLMSKGVLKVLEPGKPFNQGEVSKEDVEGLLKNIGADSLSGVPVSKLIEYNTKSFYVIIWLNKSVLKLDDIQTKLIFDKIIKSLENRKLKYKVIDSDFSSGRKDFGRWIGVFKKQD
jgi:hypothetical protein